MGVVRTIWEALKLGVQADVQRAITTSETNICTKCRKHVARQKGGMCISRTIVSNMFGTWAIDIACSVLN